MGKGQKKVDQHDRIRQFVHSRKLKNAERRHYEKWPRCYKCLNHFISEDVRVSDIDVSNVRDILAYECRNIEHQIVTLRDLILLTNDDYERRRRITQQFLSCLERHHGVVYEAVIYGSSVNGLGLSNSDVDIRLRPLKNVGDETLEPVDYDRSKAEEVLRNIAYQTTRCSPALGCFVPGRRCPIAKLTFLSGKAGFLASYREGLNCDVSLLSGNSLGAFNSVYIRFLCHLEPKFQILATVLRYWSKAHELIVPGYLSSYALVNMLIFFCTNLSKPLLPTADEMTKIYVQNNANIDSDGKFNRALTRQEWNCLICLDKKSYQPSENTEPLCVLLLKFFEFYLNFPYSGKTIMVMRTGKPSKYEDFRTSVLFDADFPMRSHLNIQDPFDLKHNLTSGMDGPFFKRFIETIRRTYEELCKELVSNFRRPASLNEVRDDKYTKKTYAPFGARDPGDWGLNVLFSKLS